ncbi:MAG: D-alanyl-D-alanine carboxypeptidase family protein, partial [Pigmentiphaga sp.]
QEAERLGMAQTHFVNATGLPHPEHLTTVRDLALLARRITQDFPSYYTYYQQREFSYNDITQPNRNRLLWLDPTVDGMKTGHTDSAGYCLVATALRGSRRIITVVVGTASETVRAQESLKLLNWSFQNFETVKLYTANQPAIQARVWKGEVEEAPLGVPEDLWVTVPRGKLAEVVPLAERTDPLIAPLTQGQDVGTLKLILSNAMLQQSPLQVLETIPEDGIFGRLVDAVRLYFE